MEHEATVVLDKDYLHKPRNPTPERENEHEHQRPLQQNDSPSGDEPNTDAGEHAEAAAHRRQNPLDKQGWFDRA